MQRQGDRIVESTTEARAAVTGQHVRYILVYSTLAVVAAFVVVFVYFFG